MLLGTLFACAHGAALPVMIIIFGSMTDMFIDNGRYLSLVDAIYPNLTEFYPNITKDWIYDNPEGFMSVTVFLKFSKLINNCMNNLQMAFHVDQHH